MKPKTDIVMRKIIEKIRDAFPFTVSRNKLCGETCQYGCPKTVLEYMEIEISEWEQRLDNGEKPTFRDIQKLSKTSKKIYKILEKNKLVPIEKQNN